MGHLLIALNKTKKTSPLQLLPFSRADPENFEGGAQCDWEEEDVEEVSAPLQKSRASGKFWILGLQNKVEMCFSL